jgi:hypothetical protein
MKPTLSLPCEIWEMILQYSISAPDFLDPDGMADRFPPWVILKRDKVGLKTYLRAEAVRCTLLRVCKSWIKYLRKYAHRFVRMYDVVHGNVPLEYLNTAIRVFFDGHYDIFCAACKPELSEQYGLEISKNKSGYWGLCSRILEQGEPLKAKILDYGWDAKHILSRHNLARSLPDVVRVQETGGYELPADNIIDFTDSLRSLCHLYL